MSTASRSKKVLNIASAMPPRFFLRVPCSHGLLRRLVTEIGGKCGLETDWAAMHEMQARLLQSGFLQERVRDWLELQDLFSKQLDETEEIFRPEREAYLKTLQERLRRVSAR